MLRRPHGLFIKDQQNFSQDQDIRMIQNIRFRYVFQTVVLHYLYMTPLAMDYHHVLVGITHLQMMQQVIYSQKSEP